MSFWNYLSGSERAKYIALFLVGAAIGVGAVVLGVVGRLSALAVFLIVTSVFVPIATRALKIKTAALKKMSPEKLSEKERKDLKETEGLVKLGESFKHSKKERAFVIFVFVVCISIALLGYLYIYLRYPEIWKIVQGE